MMRIRSQSSDAQMFRRLCLVCAADHDLAHYNNDDHQKNKAEENDKIAQQSRKRGVAEGNVYQITHRLHLLRLR